MDLGCANPAADATAPFERPAASSDTRARAAIASSATLAEMIGRTFAHYRIVERPGAGGMGEVYRAHDAEPVRFYRREPPNTAV